MNGFFARLTGRRGDLALDVTLEAKPGVTGLVGPSGAGKTTLLRALAGLERLDGEVRLDAEVWQDRARFVPAHRRRVGFVFQHGALLPHLSVGGNLAYAARRAGGGADMGETVALLRLEPLLARAPAGLSGGERRRVAVARALLTRPRLLLLDEPLSGLDTDARAALLPQLRSVLAGLAIPVIYVSHDREEIARIADRVLAIQDGRLSEADERGEDELAGLSADQVRGLALSARRAGLEPA